MIPNLYPPRTTIRINGSFIDINGNPIDPTTVIVWISGPNGLVNQYRPLRDAKGLYHYDYLTATPGGKWFYRIQGTGSVNATSLDTAFIVQIPQF